MSGPSTSGAGGSQVGNMVAAGSVGGPSGSGSSGIVPRSYEPPRPIIHHRRKRKDPDMPKRNM